ncbi:MAG: peptidoglycan recognition family protein [Verrucomicrobiota bacterium]
MFTPRFFAAILFLGAVFFPMPQRTWAVSDSGSQTSAQSQSSADSEHPTKKKAKKKKAKPKPATKKRHAQPASEEPPRRTEPEPEKKPTPAPTVPPTPAPGNVVVEKSGASEEEPAPTPEEKRSWWWPFGHSEVHYKYLTRSVRNAIDDASVARHRWRYIVVHNSGTLQGNAKAFDYYHRHVRKMPNGLAYHFVIGNGTSSGNGSIEIGPRWTNQINGGHVHSDYLNSIALGICLVGDYNRTKPTREQLEALDELIGYLRKRVGKTDHQLAIVKPHREINPPQWPTDCPGNRFPYDWLHSHFD